VVDEPSKLTLISASNVNDPDAQARVNAVVLDLARLLGRQIARDLFHGGLPANDNGSSREAGED
jgi:hypothetical protein